LKFYRDKFAVTFHPVNFEDVYSKVDFNKFPRSNTKTLIALEDLGRGSTGKAWLCVTLSKPRSAVCVLKFDNKSSKSSNLEKEKSMWNLLYPEFLMVKIELWSGSDALVMPHFAAVLDDEREMYKLQLEFLLNEKFVKKGKVHKDVRWRNIGKYVSLGKDVTLVDVDDYNVDKHKDWVEVAIKKWYCP